MDDSDTTRRRYVTVLGGTTITALAGCLSDSGASGTGDGTDDGMDDNGSMDDDDSMDEGMGDTEDSMDEGMDDDDSMDGDDPTDDGAMATTFDVVVENVSDGETLQTMDGSVAVPLSPGVFAVHSGMAHLFTPDEAASDGLEALAEDGTPDGLAAEVAEQDHVLDSGSFTTPSEMDDPGPLEPGGTYEFSIEASADDDPSLSLATMFVQSNDLFYAPTPDGVSLFEDGEPIEGDVTGEVALWDAGTEENQPPGEGPDQAPRQSEPGAGPDEMGTVSRIEAVDDGHDYPAVDEVLRVRVSTM